jgi:hypothetical protein
MKEIKRIEEILAAVKPLAADAPYMVQLVALACLPQEPCQQENRCG